MTETFSNNVSFYEAVLKQAVIQDYLTELESLPSEQELEKTLSYSPRHNARMKKLFAVEERRESIRRILTIARRSAAVAAIVFGILFGLLMLNQEVRATVVDTIVEWFETFTRFQSPESETPVFDNKIRPSYVPDGFVETLVYEDSESQAMTVVYESDHDMICMIYTPIDASLSVNNEEVLYQEIIIDDTLFYLFDAADETRNNTVIWENNELRFSLFSTIPMYELLLMAKSVF